LGVYPVGYAVFIRVAACLQLVETGLPAWLRNRPSGEAGFAVSNLRIRPSPRPQMNDQQLLFAKPGGLLDYVMVQRLGAADVVALVKSKALEPRDGTVLWALLANWDHDNSTTSHASKDLGEQLGIHPDEVTRSLSRLRKAGLLVRWHQPRRHHRRTSLARLAVLNPLFVTSGGKGQRARHLERFKEMQALD